VNRSRQTDPHLQIYQSRRKVRSKDRLQITRAFGTAWGLGGWLLMPFLVKIGQAGAQRLRQRVVDELKTTFASHYTNVVSLAEALDPANIAVYVKRATGEKFLINPNKGK
jgi:hypothetical protein